MSAMSEGWAATDAKEALIRAEDAFAAARRTLAIRAKTEISESLERFDAILDKSLERCRCRDFDTAQDMLTGAKILVRKISGVQNELQRQETEITVAAAKEAMDEAVSKMEQLIRSAEGAELLNKAQQRWNVIQPIADGVIPRRKRNTVELHAVWVIAGFVALMLVIGQFIRSFAG